MTVLDLTFNNRTGPFRRSFSKASDKTQTAGFYLKILKKAAQILKIKAGIGLSLNLVGESLIRSLNAEHRNQNQVTDVLAFGLGKKPVGAIMELGDIFICLPYAKKQARTAGVSPEQKLALLIIHGFLHLLGHDHERSPRAKKQMFELQKKILKNLATSD